MLDFSCTINDLKGWHSTDTVFLFDKIDSTNMEAKRHIDGLSCFPKLFIAKEQLKGRGRLGRNWSSSKGEGLYMSILFKSQVETEKLSVLSLVSGLAVCKALNKFLDNKAKLKWPNDVIVGSKKICGILTESVISKEGTAVIIGIGVNINNKFFDSTIQSKGTSLFLQTNREFDIKEIAIAILEQFENYYNKFVSNGFYSLIEEYKSLCVSINREVIVKRGDRDVDAFVIDIDNSGNLIAEVENSSNITVNSCEVVVQGIY